MTPMQNIANCVAQAFRLDHLNEDFKVAFMDFLNHHLFLDFALFKGTFFKAQMLSL